MLLLFDMSRSGAGWEHQWHGPGRLQFALLVSEGMVHACRAAALGGRAEAGTGGLWPVLGGMVHIPFHSPFLCAIV